MWKFCIFLKLKLKIWRLNYWCVFVLDPHIIGIFSIYSLICANLTKILDLIFIGCIIYIKGRWLLMVFVVVMLKQ